MSVGIKMNPETIALQDHYTTYRHHNNNSVQPINGTQRLIRRVSGRTNLNSLTYHINKRTSVKVMKSRNSKAKYLTKSELIGIGLSAVLSFIIVISAMLIIQTTSWTVYNNVTDLLEAIHLVFSEASMRSSNSTPQSPISHILPLLNDVSLEYFQRNYFQRNPMVFSLTHPTPSARNNIFSILKKKYAKQRVRSVNVYTMTDNSLSGGHDRIDAEKQKRSTWWSKSKNEPPQANIIAFPAIEIALRDFRAAESIEQLNSATKGMKSQQTRSHDDNYFYLNDCEAISQMPDIKEILKNNFPTLPSQLSMNSSSPKIADNILDWDEESVCLSIGRGNITAFSGSGFHIHKHSVSVLLSGRKHWVIFPPDRVPTMGFNPFENLEQWLLSVYPHISQAMSGGSPLLDSMPFEVLQQAGEAVYIPEGWYHATRTLGLESVSVRFQAKAADPNNFYFYLVDGEQRLREKDFNGAIMSFKLGLSIQRDITLLQRLASALMLQNNLPEAASIYNELLRRNPSDPTSYAKLINIVLSSPTAIVTDNFNVTEILKKADEFKVKERVLRLSRNNY